ncbi:SpoIID/LytB domain-containing protein [Neobacillus sp. NPDC097160]|uniref:SpoIID/LytB domain-containing protein n=1 Tax=Neobacillus sp. NPDC097160 TaxID=3364298 RepID=UPI00382EA866
MKKLVTLFAVAIMLFGMMPGHKEAAASEPQIPVKLVNYLGNQSSISLKITGSYYLTGTSILLINNKTYTIKVESQKLSLYDGSTKLASGDNLTITPVNDSDRAAINNRDYMGSIKFVVDGSFVRPTNTLNMEDYLKSVVPSEMIASTWSKEALKAQAVAARSYALYWVNKKPDKIDDTTSFQAFGGAGNFHPNSTAAVEKTAGEVLTYENSVIEGIYSASNGGMTESNSNEFGGSQLPYFPIQKDEYDTDTAVEWNYTIHKQQIDTTALDLSHPDSWWDKTKETDQAITDKIKSWLYKDGYSNKQIKIVSVPRFSFYDTTESGRIIRGSISFSFFVKDTVDSTGKLSLQTKEVSGIADVVRDIIGRSTMPSTLISDMKETDDAFTVSGAGNGHGVGMSQHGANNRGNAGKFYNEILGFYYPQTAIQKQYEPAQKNNMTTGWITQGTNRYYLDSKGNATRGWLDAGGKWYYFYQNGIMTTGWVQDGAVWYFMDPSGVMKTGWIKDGATWYYLASSGAMKTGWLKDGATWYYLASSGAMKTGWVKDGASWYYMDPSGAMKTGWLKEGTSWYYLDGGGVMKTGWVAVSGSWYYFYSNGIMAANTSIGGYRLGSSGAWIK